MAANAFVTYVIRNDSYIPGALLLAYALRQMDTPADLVCLTTPDISARGRSSLELLFDRTITVEPLSLSCCRDQRRQYLSQVLSRINVLRLGSDGDLGCAYAKVVLLDADLLPLRCFDHLFALATPAGVLNERADYLKQTDDSRRYLTDLGQLKWGRWRWHSVYRTMGHGQEIPSEVTDRVASDPGNYGVNSALLVVSPNMSEYESIRDDLEKCEATRKLCAGFRWPDMQYLTMRWSGRWHNVDACFAGIGGYPSVSVLFGTHFAGPKPWQVRHKSVLRSYSRYPDFQRWYREYLGMMAEHPRLRGYDRLARLEGSVRELIVSASVEDAPLHTGRAATTSPASREHTRRTAGRRGASDTRRHH